MDSFDLNLLKLMQKNNRLTADELSEKIGLSSSACQKRLKRLRKDGVIESDISVISPEALGRNLMLVVSVTLEREQPDIIDKFKRSMRDTDEVMQCFYVTGNTDFVMILTARNMEHYDAFTKRFLYDNPHIRRFETSVVVDRVKFGLGVAFDLELDTDCAQIGS